MNVMTRQIKDPHKAEVALVVPDNIDNAPCSYNHVCNFINEIIQSDDSCKKCGIHINLTAGMDADGKFCRRTAKLTAITANLGTDYEEMWKQSFIHIARKLMKKLAAQDDAIVLIDDEAFLLFNP